VAVGIDLPDLPPLNLQQVNTGLQPDDGLGDTWFQAFAKHNANMEKLALFCHQTIHHINSLNSQITDVLLQLATLPDFSDRIADLELALANIRQIDLSDILARLAALEARTSTLPISIYAEQPVSMLGFGKMLHTGFSQVKALGYGVSTNPYSIKGLGMFTGGNPIRVMMYNSEWRVAGEDERVNTGSVVTWYVFFSVPVAAQNVVSVTFTNQYTGSGNSATVGSQTVVPLDNLGAAIAVYNAATTYQKGSIVSNNSNIFYSSAKWYRSKTANNVGNSLTNTTHWEEITKRTSRFKVTAQVTSAGGERYLKLGFPAGTDIWEFPDSTGRKALMPCLDAGMITVVAA
jgi:hypothetical protein